MKMTTIMAKKPCDKYEIDIGTCRPAERQRDQPTWSPILLNVCETELEEMDLMNVGRISAVMVKFGRPVINSLPIGEYVPSSRC